jgi:hypothetical protein
VTLTAKQEKEVHEGALRALRYLDTRTSDVAGKVWATPVNRGGAKISALQELADAKTLGQQIKVEVAKQVSGIDYEKLANLVIGKLVNEVGIKITGVGK